MVVRTQDCDEVKRLHLAINHPDVKKEHLDHTLQPEKQMDVRSGWTFKPIQPPTAQDGLNPENLSSTLGRLTAIL